MEPSATDVLKSASKTVTQETAEKTGDLIANKVADIKLCNRIIRKQL